MKEGWTYKKLGEVCDKGSSNVVINKLADNNGDYPLFGASGLVKNVDFFHQDKEYIGIVKDGAGVGRVNTYPAYSSLVGTMQYIFPKEQCLLSYVKYFLIKLDLSHCVSGATIPHIYFKDYGKELIPIPSIEEQQSIVAELDEINNLLRLKRKELETYDKLAQSLFYEMFGDPVENEKGWEVKKLGEVCETTSGGTPSSKKSEYYEGGNIPWLRSGEVSQGFITETGMLITEKGMANSSAKYVPVNSVAIAMYGATVGQVGIIKKKMTTNQAICSIFPCEKITPIYLMYFMRQMKPHYLKLAVGGAQPNISQAIIKSTKLTLPPLPLQQTFATRIEAIEAQKAQVKTAIEKLETLLAARMQYWFD